jgi:hypothetical protein
MWQLWTAEQMGMAGYINWPNDRRLALQPYFDTAKFAEIPNMYEWYFEQPLFKEAPPREKVWIWEHCPELGTYPFMSQPLAVIRAYYQKHLRFNAVVNARGDALVKKYGIDFNKTIGITWRGTDNVTDGRPRLPIELYFPFIDDILAKDPDLRIMATAEETGILAPLLARYPSAFMVEEFRSSPMGSLHNPERDIMQGSNPLPGFERGMQPALMVWLFSKCKHLVKNRSSASSVSSWLSHGRIVSLAHRETLDYTQMPDQAEIEGQLVPLRR